MHKTETKKEIVQGMLKKGMLVSQDILDSDRTLEKIKGCLEKNKDEELLFLNKQIIELLENRITDINWKDLESAKAIAEKEGDDTHYNKFLSCLTEKKETKTCIDEIKQEGLNVVFNYDEPNSKKEVQDFVKYYNARYNHIEALLKNRQELSGLTSIARIRSKRDRENVALIGLVSDKRITPKGHVLLRLEDKTGTIKVLISNSKHDLLELGKNTVLDEVVGLTGVSGDKIVFCTNIITPDVPLNKELKKHPEEIYAIFLSDLHVGSDNFLDEKFDKFLRWLNGEIGSDEHKKIIKKIEYIFIAGDLVDGVGIYPNQESELLITDIFEQYKVCADLLSKIPKHIKIIVCPGNHDSIRLSEPQPAFDREFAAPLYKLENMTFVSNPAVVNIAARHDFPGFDVLLYHGYSFDYFISNVDSIRNNGGYERADLVMKFLLQRRHLSPSHTATLYVPDKDRDPLFISKIPDFFVSGHIHYSSVANYRNITMISGSCFQATTSFQTKFGHNPALIPTSIASLTSSNLQNFSFATSSPILSATLQSKGEYFFSSSIIRFVKFVPTRLGATELIKPSTLSAMFFASLTSTKSSGSLRCFLAAVAIL